MENDTEKLKKEIDKLESEMSQGIFGTIKLKLRRQLRKLPSSRTNFLVRKNTTKVMPYFQFSPEPEEMMPKTFQRCFSVCI